MEAVDSCWSHVKDFFHQVKGEFLGTFVLVFTIGCLLDQGSPFAGLVTGCVLMVLVYALGSSSGDIRRAGAHFNPAVTLSVAIADHGYRTHRTNSRDRTVINYAKAPCYMIAQLIACILAAWCFGLLKGDYNEIRVHRTATCPVDFPYSFQQKDSTNPDESEVTRCCSTLPNVSGHTNCSIDTGGSCMLFPCEASRNAHCRVPAARRRYTISRCLCDPGRCADLGRCEAPSALPVNDTRHADSVSVCPHSSACPHNQTTCARYDQQLPGDVGDHNGPWEEDYSSAQQFWAECIYTAMLCFVVLNVANSNDKPGNEYFGLAIGFALVVGQYAVGPVSGGCFNPAVAISLTIAKVQTLSTCFWFVVAELLGAAFAAGVFNYIRDYDNVGSYVISEFVGTYMLVLTYGLNALHKDNAFGVVSIASSLMCMIYALGDVSGGHFNPAVTLAVSLRDWRQGDGIYFDATSRRHKQGDVKGRMTSGKTAGYIFVQFAAGVLATLTYGKGFTWSNTVHLVGNTGAVLGAEFMFTLLLVSVVLFVTSKTAAEALKDQFFGLAIGACIIVGGSSVGGISGGCLNPAISLGIAVVKGGETRVFPYLLAQFLASISAFLIFLAFKSTEGFEEVAARTSKVADNSFLRLDDA